MAAVIMVLNRLIISLFYVHLINRFYKYNYFIAVYAKNINFAKLCIDK